MTEETEARRPSDDGGRVSIWGVRPENRDEFAAIFSFLFVIGIGFMVWYDMFHVTADGAIDTIIAIILKIGGVGLSSVALTFARFEIGDTMGVALEIYRKRRYERGRADGRAEAEAEAEAKYGPRIAALESHIAMRGIDLADAPSEVAPDASAPSNDDMMARIEALERQVAEILARNGDSPSDG